MRKLDSEWLNARETQAVFDALARGGAETRAVGGAVRDALLGRKAKPVDLATTATPDDVMRLAEQAGLKAVPTGLAHGTVTIVARGKPFEVTTLRRDVETDGRHAKVAFTDSWEEDARRRDFTLNALYAARDGTVFDPLGGMADLEAGRVRFIGDAEARIREDYLRILRFFRFNAYYGRGDFDAEGLRASVKLRDGLSGLSAERVGGELKRILEAPRAYQAIETLFDYGLLTALLGGVPRLARLQRLIAVEDTLGLEPDPALRLGALAVFVEEDVSRLADRLRFSNDEQSGLMLTVATPAYRGLPGEGHAKELLYRLKPEAFRRAILIAWADSGEATGAATWREAFSLPERWTAPDFPVRGNDIAALGLHGPEIGAALRKLERAWIASDFALDREALIARAKQSD